MVGGVIEGCRTEILNVMLVMLDAITVTLLAIFRLIARSGNSSSSRSRRMVSFVKYVF